MSDVGRTSRLFRREPCRTIDNMVDRSPAGRLEVAGGVLRYMHNCNWKMLVENLTDTCHPMVAHESSAGNRDRGVEEDGARQQQEAARRSRFMRRSCRPNEFFREEWLRIWRNGMANTGRAPFDSFRLFGDTRLLFDKMVAAYGVARAKAILDENRHNTSYFPPISNRQGTDPVDPPVQAARARPHARRILDLPPRRRAGRAARAHAHLQRLVNARRRIGRS